jgi:hypothetical protein
MLPGMEKRLIRQSVGKESQICAKFGIGDF